MKSQLVTRKFLATRDGSGAKCSPRTVLWLCPCFLAYYSNFTLVKHSINLLEFWELYYGWPKGKQTDLGNKCTQDCWYCGLQTCNCMTWRWNEWRPWSLPLFSAGQNLLRGGLMSCTVFWIPPYTLIGDDLPSYHYIMCKAYSYKSKCSALPLCPVFLQVEMKITLVLYIIWRQSLMS